MSIELPKDLSGSNRMGSPDTATRTVAGASATDERRGRGRAASAAATPAVPRNFRLEKCDARLRFRSFVSFKKISVEQAHKSYPEPTNRGTTISDRPSTIEMAEGLSPLEVDS